MNKYFDSLRESFEKSIDIYCQTQKPANTLDRKSHKSHSIHQAVEYALKGRGKRVRPLLTMLCCRIAGGNEERALRAALAVEMIHNYSLIHDDLPCMDDDDLRRGRPTVHKAFDEAIALLAGDALLTDAFALLSSSNSEMYPAYESRVALSMIHRLASSSGSMGMILGQSWDLMAQDVVAEGGMSNPDQKNRIHEIHLLKTGRLFGAACALGALSASENAALADDFQSFGGYLGLSFQYVDDIIDDDQISVRQEMRQKAQQSTDQAIETLSMAVDRYKLNQSESQETGVQYLKQFISSLLERCF